MSHRTPSNITTARIAETLAEAEAEKHELRESNSRLLRQLAKAKARDAALVEAVIKAAKDATLSMGPVRPVAIPRPDKRHGGEVALWHLTDWQGAKKTTTYNSDVMRTRVLRFCEKARHITDIQRKDHPVKEVAILFGGDMIEGLFNFPSQPFEIDGTLFEQFVRVSRLMVDVVRAALSDHERVTVVAEWGNHGRIGSIRSAVPKSDNADRMTYELARSILRGESRLTWDDCPEDVQRVEIGNYRALLMHGDEIGRGGSASPMTIVRHCDRWRSGAYPWAFRDVLVGHFHTHAEWPMANGEGAVYQTGSTESDNRYARDTMAASAKPSQRLHFVDPVRGRVTSQYKVHLED